MSSVLFHVQGNTVNNIKELEIIQMLISKKLVKFWDIHMMECYAGIF